MFLLQCPKCRQRMKYQSVDGKASGKRKRCVYCGASMSVSSCIVKRI